MTDTAIAAPKRDFSTFSALSDITNTAAGSITHFFQPLGTAKDPTSRCQAHNHMAQTALDAAGRATRPGYVAPVPYLFENAALTGAWVRRDVHQEQFGNNTAPNTYYSFKPDDPVYGVFSEWRYPATAPVSTRMAGRGRTRLFETRRLQLLSGSDIAQLGDHPSWGTIWR